MTLETGVKELAEAVGADVKALEDGKVNSNDPRLTDAREWSEATVPQAEAEAGTASTRRAWTAQRVRQAIAAWYLTVSSTFTRTLLGRSTAAQVRGDLELGTAATRNVGESSGDVMEVGAGGWLGRTPNSSYISGFPANIEESITTVYRRASQDGDVGAYVPSIHIATENTWGRLRISHLSPTAWLQGGYIGGGTPWTAEVIHTGNILTTTGQSALLPMTQKAVTDALNTKANIGANGWGVTAQHNLIADDVDFRDLPSGSYSVNRTHPQNIFDDGATLLVQARVSFNTTFLLQRASGFDIAISSKFSYPSGDIQWSILTGSQNLLQATGQSTEYPMTQKAVTDAINGVSDRRDKLDITSSGVGLDLIEKLEPVSFRLNKRDWYRNQAATSVETYTDEDGTQTEAEKINPDVISKPLTDYDDNDGSLARDDKYTGLIAQDVKAALEDLGLGDLAIIKNYSDEYEGGDDRHYIEYNGLIPVMINAIKELSARVKGLEIKVEREELDDETITRNQE